MNKKYLKIFGFTFLLFFIIAMFIFDAKFKKNIKLDVSQISSFFTDNDSSPLRIIDEDFPGLSDENKKNTRIDINNIQSGGPRRNDIPSLIHPNFDDVSTSIFENDELVIGVYLNGEARAYPYSILYWHEIINDTVGNIPITVTLCPLCETNPVFERTIDGEVTTFGVSGQLFNGCMIMYDRKTETLWSQPWGIGVLGDNVNQELKKIPAQKTTLGAWKKKYPDTLILSTDTGHKRNYAHYPYGTYRDSDKILFPVRNQENLNTHPKEIISYIWQNNNETPFNIFSGESYKISHKELKEKKSVFFKFNNAIYTAIWNNELNNAQFFDENNIEIPSSTGFAFFYPAYFE